jgi:hypothetical protein
LSSQDCASLGSCSLPLGERQINGLQQAEWGRVGQSAAQSLSIEHNSEHKTMARAISADAGSARCDGVRDTELNAQTLPGPRSRHGPLKRFAAETLDLQAPRVLLFRERDQQTATAAGTARELARAGSRKGGAARSARPSDGSLLADHQVTTPHVSLEPKACENCRRLFHRKPLRGILSAIAMLRQSSPRTTSGVKILA